MVFGYERKGFIRLQECFRVSKTEDHDQQFNSWRHSYFLLPLFFDLPFFSFFFFFFIALLEHTHFILVITFSSLAWVSWALYAFLAFSWLFLISHWNFLLPPSVGCDPSRDFFHERKNYSGSKRGSKGCTYFRTWKE